MIQLKNYLSRIHPSAKCNILLLVSEKEVHEMICCLQKFIWIQKIYLVPESKDKVSFEKYKTGLIEVCHIDQILKNDRKIDIALFGKGREPEIYLLSQMAPLYLIGEMSNEWDYFSTWENFRRVSSYIYIVKERNQCVSKEEGVAEKYEIMEWEKPQNGIELSVILPTYNVEKYLTKCIETLTKWKAPYVEYLFINDGSTDHSASIIQEYAEMDHRVRLFNKENGGCASARNYGIEKAQGRYIGFIDADDFIDENMFQKLLRRIMMGNYEFAYCGYQEYLEDSGKIIPVQNDYLGEPYLTGTYRSEKVQMLAVNTRVAIWRSLYKKSVLDEKNIRFHEELKRFDDLPFRIEYIFAVQSAVCLSEHLYYYRIGREEQDTACKDERLFVHFDIFRYLDDYLNEYKDRKLWDLLQVVKIQTHGYAIKKIDQKWKKPYINRAGIQLREHAGYIRNVILILLYAGKGNLVWFTRMWMRSKF